MDGETGMLSRSSHGESLPYIASNSFGLYKNPYMKCWTQLREAETYEHTMTADVVHSRSSDSKKENVSNNLSQSIGLGSSLAG